MASTHLMWLPSLLSGLAGLGLVFYLRHQPDLPGRGYFALSALALTIWSMGNTGQLAADTLAAKRMWIDIQYLGIASVPGLWVGFALSHAGLGKWLTRGRLIMLWTIPVATLILAWTNDMHHLIWSRVWLDTSGPFPMEASSHGPWFWMWVVFMEAVLVAVTFILIRTSGFLKPPLHFGAVLLIAGLALPWMTSFVFLSGIGPWPHFDTTHMGFTLSAWLITLALCGKRRSAVMMNDEVLKALADPLFVINSQGVIINLNPAGEMLLGLTGAQVIGQPASIHLDGALVSDRAANGEVHEREVTVSSDGHEVIYDLQSSVVRHSGSEAAGRLVVLRDITDRKRMDDALRVSEKRLFQAIHRSPDGVVITRLSDGLIVDVNQTFTEKMVFTREEVLGKTTFEINLWANTDDRQVFVDGLSTPPHEVQMETAYRAKDGRVVPAYISSRLLEMDGEMHIITVAVDISREKEEEAELQARSDRINRQQAAIIAAATDPSLVRGDLGRAARLLTAEAAEALDVDRVGVWLFNGDRTGLKCLCVYLAADRAWVVEPPLDPAGCPDYIQALTSNRALEVVDTGTDGRTAEAACADLAGRNAVSRMDVAVRLGGEVVGAVVVGHSAEQRRWLEDETAFTGQVADQVAQTLLNQQSARAEEALRSSEERYRFLIEHLPYGLFVSTLPQGRFVYANRIAADIFGREMAELLEMDLWQLVDPREHETIRQRITDRLEGRPVSPKTWIYSLVQLGGEVIRCETASALVDWQGEQAIMSFFRDVTEEEMLERQLHQSQKMEAVGTLASGVAHDFNNLLQVISGYTQLLSVSDELNEEDRDHVARIEKATGRAADLIRRLSTFARKAEAEKRPLDAKLLVEQAVDMLRRTIPRMIDIRLDQTGETLMIEGDPTTLEQVLMNLGTNARDAMPDGGIITITTRRLNTEDQGPAADTPLEPGQWVEIRFSDTGQGMDQPTQARIFEPFFTTKDLGKGTGLGLSTAYGIVHSHGGRISCHSEAGRGAAFVIHLPLLTGVKEDEIPRQTTDPAAGRGETVLVVDDEEAIRSVASEALELHGFIPLVASTGEEALEIFREGPDEIAMVILDLGMPGMGGMACLAELERIKPQVKVLIASGYGTEEFKRNFRDRESHPYLAKPYRLADLMEEVRSLLDM